MPPAAAAAHVRGVVDAGAPRSDVWRGPLKSWVRIATAARACVSARSLTHAHAHAHAHTQAHTLIHARTRTHMPSHTCTHGASRQTWERCPENTHFSRDTENAVHSRDLGDVWPQQDGNLRPRLVSRRPPRRACALPRAASCGPPVPWQQARWTAACCPSHVRPRGGIG